MINQRSMLMVLDVFSISKFNLNCAAELFYKSKTIRYGVYDVK